MIYGKGLQSVDSAASNIMFLLSSAKTGGNEDFDLPGLLADCV